VRAMGEGSEKGTSEEEEEETPRRKARSAKA
jgi:hypothetical protein